MTPLFFRVVAAPAGVLAPPLPSFAAAGTIGRSEGNTLVLSDPAALLSRQHCRLEPTPGGWQVVDLSSNGTFVNDMLVGRGNVRPVRPGDRLRLGEWQLLVEGSAPAAAPGPMLPAEADPMDPFGVGDISRAQPAAPVHVPLPPRADGPEPLFGATADPFGPGASPNPFGGAPPLADPFGAPPAAPPMPDVPPVLSGGMEQMAVPLPMPAGAAPGGGGGLPDDWMDEALAGLGPKPAAAPPPPLAPPPLAEPILAPPPPLAPPPAAARMPAPAGGGLAAFAEGAGIAPPPGLDEAAALAELGRANRLLARSLMRLLAARRAVKSEFRISQTVVAAAENNPLKFSADEAEMVALLLGVSRPGFQAGSRAVADAARDLEAHQVALLAAFRAVVAALFARLDPAVIGGKDDDAGLLGRLTGGAKSAAWDAYVKAYADLKQDFSESLRGRLAQVFAEAYEAESRRHGGS
jgi:type VI secretion system protein ImpI/type VI secretion system protein